MMWQRDERWSKIMGVAVWRDDVLGQTAIEEEKATPNEVPPALEWAERDGYPADDPAESAQEQADYRRDTEMRV